MTKPNNGFDTIPPPWFYGLLRAVALVTAIWGFVPTLQAQEAAPSQGFQIGAGIADITGGAAEVGMMGYSLVGQTTRGIHTRLWARSFVIVDQEGHRTVLVVIDQGMVFQAITQRVVARLASSPVTAGFYNETNILLTPTHTHSGPGGFSHYMEYNLAIFEFNAQNFNVIVDGIVSSIEKAHANLAPGRILINEGKLQDAAWNRSPLAYQLNPAAERDAYDSNVDDNMTLLRFVRDDGRSIGEINWFGLHNTSIGNTNRLISSDNKGLAAYLFEKRMGVPTQDRPRNPSFVAAFAQSTEGDVSPNIALGYPDGIHDYEHMKILAIRQADAAQRIFDEATTPLGSVVDTRHTHVNFVHHPIAAAWLQDRSEDTTTCGGAIGLAKIAGSTEDGVGIPIFHEGMVYGKGWPRITLMPAEQRCQAEKIILIPSSSMKPYPWSPEVLPLQIVRIGELAIVAAPFEITTMAGRRLKNTVRDTLAPLGITHVVVASMANAYSDYLTTREEYSGQHYEGASNSFGPYTLNACQQEFNRLATAMAERRPIAPGPTPRDLSLAQVHTPFMSVLFDAPPRGRHFGDVEKEPADSYRVGDTAQATFWGGHPKNNLKTGDSYLYIEREGPQGWQRVAFDWDPETTYRWQRVGVAASRITISWNIPAGTPEGTYRIVHEGHAKSLLGGKIKPYRGVSASFHVDE